MEITVVSQLKSAWKKQLYVWIQAATVLVYGLAGSLSDAAFECLCYAVTYSG
jgi:hypothetical protein